MAITKEIVVDKIEVLEIGSGEPQKSKTSVYALTLFKTK